MMAFTVNVVLVQSLICASLMFGWSSGISVYDPPPRRPTRTHYRGPADVDEYATATDPPRYNFAYDVSDAYTGDIKSQTETRDGDVVRGQYSLIEPDGTRRVVDYTADEHNGFNAVVSKEGVHSAASATVAPRPPAAVVAYKPAAVSYKPTGAYKPARRPVAYKPSVAAAYRPAPAAIYQQQPDDPVYPTAATAYYPSSAAAAYYGSTATTYPTTAATAYPSAPLYKSAYKRTLAYDQPPSYYAYRPPHY